MANIDWVIINCNSKKEAHAIGAALLGQRLIACFDVIPEREAVYFWPPRSGKIEKIKGSMLICVSLPKKYLAIQKRAKKLHSDKVPFIGKMRLQGVDKDYMNWLTKELA
jgi:periplasmic divalent cation tolerance protein